MHVKTSKEEFYSAQAAVLEKWNQAKSITDRREAIHWWVNTGSSKCRFCYTFKDRYGVYHVCYACPLYCEGVECCHTYWDAIKQHMNKRNYEYAQGKNDVEFLAEFHSLVDKFYDTIKNLTYDDVENSYERYSWAEDKRDGD
jgi:hypothetical protein